MSDARPAFPKTPSHNAGDWWSDRSSIERVRLLAEYTARPIMTPRGEPRSRWHAVPCAQSPSLGPAGPFPHALPILMVRRAFCAPLHGLRSL